MSQKPKKQNLPAVRRVGRPVTTGTQKSREVGRWSDEDWQLIHRAAEITGADSVAGWCKRILRSAAKRVVSKG